MDCSEVFLADACMYEKIQHIIHKTLLKKCKKYNGDELEKYFLSRDTYQIILRNINCRRTYVLVRDGLIIGTASLYRNSIQQIYILYEYENSQAVTKFIFTLESILRKKYDNIVVDSFFVDPMYYMKLGYVPKKAKVLTLTEGGAYTYFLLGKCIKGFTKILWNDYKIKNFTLDYYSRFRDFRNDLMYEKVDEFYDSFEQLLEFLLKNPTTNFILLWKERVVGVVLCGTDGRRGYINLIQLLRRHQEISLVSELISAVLDELANIGVNEIVAVQSQSNVDISFLETIGFELSNNGVSYSSEILAELYNKKFY